MPPKRRTSIWLQVAVPSLVAMGTAGAQVSGPGKLEATKPDPTKPELSLAPLSAPAAVREGNRRLLTGSPDTALEAYRHAEELAPDAREVAFVGGLAHYDLAAFDEARRAFERAAGSHDDALADDALYSLGTCDHAEAFEKSDNPEEAMALLESAMKRYRNVLDHRPDHAAARDANFKAASMWRQIKQLMEEQQQQQQESGENGEQEPSDEEKQEQQQQEGDQEQQDEQQQSSEQESQDQSQESQQQQAQEGNEEQEQKSAAAEQEDEQQQDEAQPKPDEKEQVSREQAERKLREMMQALRDREKARRQQVERMPVRAVEKDW